jgi:hypothetical protein
MISPILRYFDYEHLPRDLQDVSHKNIWRIIRAEPDPDIEALLDPDVDPTRSQDWSTRAYRLSDTPDTSIPDFSWDIPVGPEKSAGLRKLLEAKDCIVRAALDK